MMSRVSLGLLAGLMATPALAQPADMPRQPPLHGEGGPAANGPAGGRAMGEMRGRPGRLMRLRHHVENGLYAGMSEEGRRSLSTAMRGNPADRIAERRAVSAARDKVMTLLEAERLDTAALKRAMDEERAAAEATHQRRQAAVFAALQRLSPADRKAFAANARAMKNRMDDRLRAWEQRTGPAGPGGPDLPPPMLW